MRGGRVLGWLGASLCAAAVFAPGALADKQVGAQPIDMYSGDVTMAQGENLTFQNLDLQNHDVTADVKGADGKPLFASATIGFGQTAKVEGAQSLGPGTYQFHCSVHPFMTAKLTVTGSGTPASPPSSGGGSSTSSAPSVSVSLGNAKLSKVRKSRKLPVKVTVNEASTVSLTALVGKKAIAAGKAILSSGGSTTMNLSLNPAGRKALKHKHSVKVELKAVAGDSAGNKGAASSTAKLRG